MRPYIIFVAMAAVATAQDATVPQVPAWVHLRVQNAIIDGEIVYLDASGKPQFYSLLRRRTPQHFVAFDILWPDGKDLRALPLLERKRMLRTVVPAGSPVLHADYTLPEGALENASRVLQHLQTWPPQPPPEIERMRELRQEQMERMRRSIRPGTIGGGGGGGSFNPATVPLRMKWTSISNRRDSTVFGIGLQYVQKERS